MLWDLKDQPRGVSEWQVWGPSSHSQPHLVQPARLKPNTTRKMTTAKRSGKSLGINASISHPVRRREHPSPHRERPPGLPAAKRFNLRVHLRARWRVDAHRRVAQTGDIARHNHAQSILRTFVFMDIARPRYRLITVVLHT